MEGHEFSRLTTDTIDWLEYIKLPLSSTPRPFMGLSECSFSDRGYMKIRITETTSGKALQPCATIVNRAMGFIIHRRHFF
jgi:hypothetical protein